MRFFSIVLLAAFLPACAITEMEAKIAPSTDFASSTVGQGQLVGLTIIDERPSKDLGKRAAAGAKIVLKDDLSVIIYDTISAGLVKNSFVVQPGNVSGASNLRVDIRSLDYDVSTGWFTGGITISSSMKATASNQAETYEKFYRSDDEERVVFIPGAADNNEKINAVIDQVVDQIFADEKLLSVLANSPTVPATPSTTTTQPVI